jgi:predicted RNase H-like nuclease
MPTHTHFVDDHVPAVVNPPESKAGGCAVFGDNSPMRVIGIDLAWGEGSTQKLANETGLVAVDQSGVIVDAGWASGLGQTAQWIEVIATSQTLLMVDAPLVVSNVAGQRLCEKQVGQRYGKWKVSANSTNLGSRSLAGVALTRSLQERGWRYHDGCDGVPPSDGRHLAEVYPYTTLVGAAELGYSERPVYKRRPKSMPLKEFRGRRAANCDDLVARLATLCEADPRIDLRSHPVTRALVDEASPLDDRHYKHREDLIDAALCAWTGLLWLAHGLKRCQVLGIDDPATPIATIIAPARNEQRK